MKLRLLSICCCLLTLSSQASFAGGADLPLPRNTIYRHPELVLPPPKPWIVSSDLYLWGIASQGKFTMNSRVTEPEAKYRKFLRHMRSAAMASIGASKGPYGLALNGLFVDLKYLNDVNGQRQELRNNFGVLEGVFSYRAYKRIISRDQKHIIRSFTVVPYVGTRLLTDSWHIKLNDVDIDKGDQWWMQPLAGSRFIFQFFPNWNVALSSDFAYWNVDNKTFNNILMLSYNKLFGVDILSFNLGYRYMYVYRQVEGNKFKMDMNLYGPLFGMSITI